MELSKLILKAGYTPKMLAKEMGVTVYAVYAYTQGRAFPSAENLLKMCKILGYTEATVLETIKLMMEEK